MVPLRCPALGTWPEIQACALTGNRTSDLSVLTLALNPLSLTSQVCSLFSNPHTANCGICLSQLISCSASERSWLPVSQGMQPATIWMEGSDGLSV